MINEVVTIQEKLDPKLMQQLEARKARREDRQERIMERLRTGLSEYYRRLGRLPEKWEFFLTTEGRSFYGFCYSVFKGYKNACLAAGYSDAEIEKMLSKKTSRLEKMKSSLSEYYKKSGELPSRSQLYKMDGGSLFILFCQRHFGSYEAACVAAGYSAEEVELTKKKDSNAPRTKSLEKVKRVLGEYYTKLGYLPSKTELLQFKEGAFYIFCYRQFGGYEKACTAAGYNVEECMARYIRRKERKKLNEEKEFTKLQIGAGLKELYGKLERMVTEADLPLEGLLSKENICLHFTTLGRALIQNGLPWEQQYPHYTDEEIIDELRRLYAGMTLDT